MSRIRRLRPDDPLKVKPGPGKTLFTMSPEDVAAIQRQREDEAIRQATIEQLQRDSIERVRLETFRRSEATRRVHDSIITPTEDISAVMRAYAQVAEGAGLSMEDLRRVSSAEPSVSNVPRRSTHLGAMAVDVQEVAPQAASIGFASNIGGVRTVFPRETTPGPWRRSDEGNEN